MNEIKISFLSKLENIGIIRNMITCITVSHNPSINFINELKVIISEAITNSIVHGYQNKPDETIEITIKDSVEEIEITVLDNGVGIPDVSLAREPLFSTKKDEERSGLGFSIMEMFSTSFDCLSTVNEGSRTV
jgi:stage II sporulation protein AB (anti-sigma F factor)